MANFRKKPAASVGAPFSAQECHQLSAAFKAKYPTQVSSVFISKQLLLQCVEASPDASGIFFLFGLEDPTRPSSRRIFLVPTRACMNEESAIIRTVSPKGYLCDDGSRVVLDAAMQLLANHVSNFSSEESEIYHARLPRGYFWGIEKLSGLLGVESCAGVEFHFGFDAVPTRICRRYINVLEAVDDQRRSLNIFLEYGQCDPPCDDPNDPKKCTITDAAQHFLKEPDTRLDQLRLFRDEWLLQQPNGQALYELYYFLSESLVAAINDRPDSDAIWHELYHADLSTCLQLIEEKRYEETKAWYVALMHSLAGRFLLQEATVGALS